MVNGSRDDISGSDTNSLQKRIALAAVVTNGVVEEFAILRLSFELFHGPGFHWYVRCCDGAEAVLSGDAFVHCTTFAKGLKRRLDTSEPAFNIVAEQKMHAIDDVWKAGSFEAVMLLDADIIVTAPFAHALLPLDADVLLTPSHWHTARHSDIAKYGLFNSGFIFTTHREFHTWWREAFVSQPEKFTDQQCLDDASKRFRVKTLGEEANVGFWRAENGTTRLNDMKIPENCTFLHAHLYQPPNSPDTLIRRIFAEQYTAFTSDKDLKLCPFSWYQLQVKAFALCCLSFLQASSEPKHQQLFKSILDGDRLGLYAAILQPSPSTY